KVPGYLRYGDDLACFRDRREDLRRWRVAIGEWLAAERGLRLKHPEARILSCGGHLNFIGHRISRDGHRPLGKARRRLAARLRAALDGEPGPNLARSLASSARVMLF
ncbi:MAG: hypothetical protein KC620_26465, partial [Myxococcales bacterium]|nr:hypothetical protein [Myxococcales bacterium]